MVLKRLMAMGAGRAKQHRLPEGRRIYAIGDVHGRLDLLDALLDQIAESEHRREPADTAIIFLGDLVDRGPDSCGVVERAMELKAKGRVAALLMGNHEEIMLAAADGDLKMAGLFARVGGRETLLSYGVPAEIYNSAHVEEIPGLIERHVPVSHLSFLRKFQDMYAVGDYLFVHAGIRPQVPVAEQNARDLRWIRGEFLTYRGDHDAMVVHGHSIADAVEERSNRINIDTGAYATGRLTAIGLEGGERWFLATNDAVTDR